jgi:hypothetical protein
MKNFDIAQEIYDNRLPPEDTEETLDVDGILEGDLELLLQYFRQFCDELLMEKMLQDIEVYNNFRNYLSGE